MPAVSVLVVNFNAGPLLADCLRHLAAQTMADFEAIVIDNGSADTSLALAQAAVRGDPRFRFKVAGANLGFAAGNNRAAADAAAPWLALLNPDAFAAPDWLAQLLAAAARHPDVPLFGCTQYAAHDSARLDGAGDQYFAPGIAWRGGFGWPAAALPAESETFSACAAAALCRTDMFRALGGFDERFFCYYEDVDFGFRLRLQGLRAIQVPSAAVRHVGGGTTKDSDFASYHGARNMIWCFAKNMPTPLLWLLAPLHLLLLSALLLRKLPQGQGPAVVRGIRDAIAGLPAIWRDRQRVQQARRISGLQLARALSWNPQRFLTRAPRA